MISSQLRGAGGVPGKANSKCKGTEMAKDMVHLEKAWGSVDAKTSMQMYVDPGQEWEWPEVRVESGCKGPCLHTMDFKWKSDNEESS